MKTPRKRSTNKRHRFHRNAVPQQPRSVFPMNCDHTTTFNAGDLIPIYCQEVLPNDTFQISATFVTRLLTPLVPFMDNIYIDCQWFFVPTRLLWENWERFWGAQDNPTDSTDFLTPIVTCPAGGWPSDSMADYFGIRPLTDNLDVLAFQFRAYNLIWNEWYRHQDLQDSVPFNTDNGPDLDTDYTILKRGKRHDYFTSALPFLQKGDPVQLPLGQSAPVTYNYVDTNSYGQIRGSSDGQLTNSPAGLQHGSTGELENSSGSNLFYDPNGTLNADLSQAVAATINDFRLAVQSQIYLEINARAGTRHSEYLLAFWGVPSQDARLQRPEYLGGSSRRLETVQVANTADIGSTGNADLGAYTQGVSKSGIFKSFPEHGYIMALVSARSDMKYQQGIPREFSRRDPFDFALPVFARIGEQGILNKEIYAQGTAADDLVFGYTERFNEYRYTVNKVTSTMRSDHPTSLDIWHLAYDFTDLPVLSSQWIEEAPPIDRIVKVQSEPQFKMDAYFQNRATRALPLRGTPGTFLRF